MKASELVMKNLGLSSTNWRQIRAVSLKANEVRRTGGGIEKGTTSIKIFLSTQSFVFFSKTEFLLNETWLFSF